MTSDGRIQTRFLQGTIVCYVLLIVFFFVLAGTDWGHQFDDDAYLGRGALVRQVATWVALLLARISNGTIMCAAALLLLISLLRRCFLAGVFATAGFLIAVVGAEILKDFLPWRALVPDDPKLGLNLQVNSYPSGHATIGTAFVLALLLVSPARWRPWLAVAAGVVSSVFTAGVLCAGWHRGSDAIGALAWSGLCMNLAAAAAVRFRGRPVTGKSNHAVLCSVAIGVLAIAAMFLVSLPSPQYPYGNLPFFLLTGLIIAGSFALTTWYAWQLRDMDFSKD